MADISHAELWERFAAARDRTPADSHWRHARSGTVYRVVGHCLIEATCEPGVIYTNDLSDGYVPPLTWCRPVAEFLDGRFTRHDGLT